MNAQDKELIQDKIAGVHAAIQANQDIQIIRDEKIIMLIQEVKGLAMEARDLGIKTNGRVTELEKKELNHYNLCPNVSVIDKICKNFFLWFDTPLKVALFWVIVIVISVNAHVLWGGIDKLISLLK